MADVLSDRASGRHAGAVFESLENRAMLSSAWVADGIMNIQGSDSPGIDMNLGFTVAHGGEAQVRVPAPAFGSFLQSNTARMDIIGTQGGDGIFLTANEPVAADIQRLSGKDEVDGGAGNDTIKRGSGTDSASRRGGNEIIYGGSGIDLALRGLGQR